MSRPDLTPLRDRVKAGLGVSDVVTALGFALEKKGLEKKGGSVVFSCPVCCNQTAAIRRDDQGWKCTQCFASGDIVGLLMDVRGVGYHGALRQLEQIMRNRAEQGPGGDLFANSGTCRFQNIPPTHLAAERQKTVTQKPGAQKNGAKS